MRMTTTQLIEAETAAMLSRLRRLGRPLKRRTAAPGASARALREAGVAEKDIATLIEGHRHEVEAARLWGAPGRLQPQIPPRIAAALDVLQEDVGTEPTTDGGMMPPTGWSAPTPGTFTHAKAPGHKLMVDGQDWRHHGPDGRIVKRGTGAQSLTEYAKTICGSNASESLDTVLARIRNGADHGPADALKLAEARLAGRTEHGPAAAHALIEARFRGERGPVAAHKLIEAIRNRAQSAPGEDLHTRLRKAATR